MASIFLRLTGPQHAGSEATGPVFNPSGTRFFLSSQRGLGGSGAVFEITGPFRLERPSSGPVAAGGGAAPTPPAPALGIEVPRTATFQRLVGPGLQVALTLDAPAAVEVTLRGRFTPRRRRTRNRRAIHALAQLRRELSAAAP